MLDTLNLYAFIGTCFMNIYAPVAGAPDHGFDVLFLNAIACWEFPLLTSALSL